MVDYILPTAETPDVDKFALLLKDSDLNEEGKGGEGDEGEEEGKLKMIGFVGTNRWSAQGMEVGYCMNVNYWGRGFASEGFSAFLDLFWSLPGEYSFLPFPVNLICLFKPGGGFFFKKKI
jgi:RimJ/RimL family protein N-acetyltransferase